MIYNWIFRTFIKPLIEAVLAQSRAGKPVKLDPLEYPELVKRGVTHYMPSPLRNGIPILMVPPKRVEEVPYYFDPKTPGILVPSVSQILRDMGVDDTAEMEAHLNEAGFGIDEIEDRPHMPRWHTRETVGLRPGERPAVLTLGGEIDLKKPRMRCHQSWFYFAGVHCREQTWTCISDSAQGVGDTALAAWANWALRLSWIERDARRIRLSY